MLFLLELLSPVLRPISSRAFSSSSCCCRPLSDFPSDALPRRSDPEDGLRRSFSFIIFVAKKKTQVRKSKLCEVKTAIGIFKESSQFAIPVLQVLSGCPVSQPWQNPATSMCYCGTPDRAELGAGPSSPHCSFLPTVK